MIVKLAVFKITGSRQTRHSVIADACWHTFIFYLAEGKGKKNNYVILLSAKTFYNIHLSILCHDVQLVYNLQRNNNG